MKENKIMKKDLIKFLRDNRCLELFTVNLKKDEEFKSIQDMTNKVGNPAEWFFVPFSWGSSIQTWKYWNDLCIKWEAICKKRSK